MHARQDGDGEAGNAGQNVEIYETVEAELAQDERPQLIKRHHVERDVKNAAVQKRGGEERPEAVFAKKRNGSGCAEQKKALIGRGQKAKQAASPEDAVREKEQSQREENDIGIENGFHRSEGEKNIAQFPRRFVEAGPDQAAVRAGRFIKRDQLAAVGAQNGVSFRGHSFFLRVIFGVQ